MRYHEDSTYQSLAGLGPCRKDYAGKEMPRWKCKYYDLCVVFTLVLTESFECISKPRGRRSHDLFHILGDRLVTSGKYWMMTKRVDTLKSWGFDGS